MQRVQCTCVGARRRLLAPQTVGSRHCSVRVGASSTLCGMLVVSLWNPAPHSNTTANRKREQCGIAALANGASLAMGSTSTAAGGQSGWVCDPPWQPPTAHAWVVSLLLFRTSLASSRSVLQFRRERPIDLRSSGASRTTGSVPVHHTFYNGGCNQE